MKKVISIILSFALIVVFIPTAFAEDVKSEPYILIETQPKDISVDYGSFYDAGMFVYYVYPSGEKTTKEHLKCEIYCDGKYVGDGNYSSGKVYINATQSGSYTVKVSKNEDVYAISSSFNVTVNKGSKIKYDMGLFALNSLILTFVATNFLFLPVEIFFVVVDKIKNGILGV